MTNLPPTLKQRNKEHHAEGQTVETPIEVDTVQHLDPTTREDSPRKRDRRILQTKEYLNDRIVNACLEQILSTTPEMDYLNSYFMEYVQLAETPNPALDPWIQKLREQSLHTWFIPVCHQRRHWLLLKINPHKRTVEQIDSMGMGASGNYTQRVRVILEARDNAPWRTQHTPTELQVNGYDCGAHVIAEVHRQVHGYRTSANQVPCRQAITALYDGAPQQTLYVEKGIDQMESAEQQVPDVCRRADYTGQSNNPLAGPATDIIGTLSDGASASEDAKESPSRRVKVQRQLNNEQHYGDEIRPKPTDTLRIYSQNVQGIPTTHTKEHFHAMLTTMTDREVDVFGWAETNLEWNDYKLNAELFPIFKKHFPQGKWLPSTSKIPFTTNYKPGGNLMGIHKNANARTHQTHRDPMGRWCWSRLEGKKKPLTIIQLYVPGSTKAAGITSSYAQQYEQIREHTGVEHPKVMETYYQDLHALLHQVNDTNIIVMGDFNNSPTAPEILDLITGHNLRDAYAQYHPGEELNTQVTGSVRIDYFLVSAPLIPYIRNIGYEPIHGSIPSDHRGMYLDLSTQVLKNVEVPRPRKLNATHGTQVSLYRDKLFRIITEKNLLSRLATLQSRHERGRWTPTHTKKLIQIDNELTDAMLKAEKTCRPAHTAPWSPTIKAAYDRVQDITRELKRILPDPGKHLRPATKQSAQYGDLWNQRVAAILELRELRGNAYQLRQTFLEEEADLQELKGNTARHIIIRNIQKVEELRRTYGHIRYATKEASQQTITRVQYPTHTGWETTKDSEDLEERILQQYRQHFRQASSTPLAQHGKIFGIPRDTHPHDLDTLQLPDTERGFKRWFRPNQTPTITTLLTIQDFRQSVQKWSERTSTSPSGRHLGHYHAQILPQLPSETEDLSEHFLYLHVTMLNLATQRNIIFPRWRQVNTICLPKDTGTPRIHRLRPLNLYEADLNLLLRVILARRLLWKIEKHNELPDEAWGNRKLRASGDVGLQKVITFELGALTRQPLGQIDLDAKSCYDRILRPVGILACYKFGLPITMCCWVSQVLEQQEHHLVTINGRSSEGYTSTREHRMHGIGQGSTAAPIIWLLISSIMLISMKTWSQGVSWESPDGEIVTKRHADSYVDDTTLWLNGMSDVQNLKTRMQSDLADYQEMLAWTGGALSLHKCFFSILEWEFTPDGMAQVNSAAHSFAIPRPPHELKAIQECTRRIRLHGITPQRRHELEELTGKKMAPNPATSEIEQYCAKSELPVTIQQKLPNDQQRSLGLCMTADGDTHGAETQFAEINKTFGVKIVSSNLQPPEVKLAHRSVHIPCQSYKFYGSPFSEKFLTLESHRMTTKLLPRLNFARNHPLALRYAPTNRGGLGLPHFYVIQGTLLVKQALKHIRLQSSLGENLHIHLQWTQLHSGLQTGILTDTNTDLKYIPNNWWTKLREFLHKIQGSLHLEKDYVMHPLQQDDRSIMEDILRSYQWQTKEKKRINACRLYLQITFVSEIATDGKTLDFQADYKTGLASRSTLRWPRQSNPNHQSWMVWRKALRKLCRSDGRTLRQPLHNAWCLIQHAHRRWKFLYDPVRELLHDTNRKTSYAQTTQTRHQHRFQEIGNQPICPESIPVHPRRTSTGWTLSTLPTRRLQVPHSSPIAPTPRHTILVSDGSVINGEGTYGWVRATNRDVLETSSGKVPGNHQTSSYRAEAQGVADGIFTSALPDKLRVYLDNEGVVKNLTKTWPIHPLKPEWELVEPTRQYVQQHSIQVHHVRGHQDLRLPQTKWEAHLNHRADRLANAAHAENDRVGHQPAGYRILLYIQGNPITTDYTREIQRAATTPAIRDYYVTKYRWSDSTMSTIDWDALGGAQKKFSIGQQRTIHKYLHGWLPTGNHMQHRYKIHSPCPHCQEPENSRHLTRCQSQTKHRTKFYLDMERKLREWNTEPGLARLLLQTLQDGVREYTGSESGAWITQLLEEQTRIGLSNIWKGFLSQTWGDIQERFYRRNKCKPSCSGAQWTRRLLQTIWKYVLETWTRRNQKLHDDPKQTPPHRKHIITQVSTIYNTHRQNPEIFRGLYKHELQELVQKKTKYLIKWLRIAAPLQDMATVKTKRQGSRDIRAYLPMATHPPDQSLVPLNNTQPTINQEKKKEKKTYKTGGT